MVAQFPSEVADFITNKIDTNKDTLGVRQVLMGKHNMVPLSPTVRVVPAPRRRNLVGVSAPGGRVENLFTTYVDVMISDALVGEAEGMRAVELLANQVEILIHNDVTLGGLIIHGFFVEADPGEEFIQNSKYRVVRLTHTGVSRTYLSA